MNCGDSNIHFDRAQLEDVKKYISTRYQRYLDYADYHASLAGLDQQGPDVLHEVVISILEKDEKEMTDLLHRKKISQGLREIDFYILRMIKLNCHSKTSPYRYRYRFPVQDGNLSTEDLKEKPVEHYDHMDSEDLTCARYEMIREILDSMDIFTEDEKEIFRWKFFLENTWRQWEGGHSKELLQRTYKAILAAIIYRIGMRKKSYTAHVLTSRQRMDGIRFKYQKSLFPGAYRYSEKYHRAENVFKKYSEKLKRITGTLNVET